MRTEKEPAISFPCAAGRLTGSSAIPEKTPGRRPSLFELIQPLDSEVDNFDSRRNGVCGRQA